MEPDLEPECSMALTSMFKLSRDGATVIQIKIPKSKSIEYCWPFKLHHTDMVRTQKAPGSSKLLPRALSLTVGFMTVKKAGTAVKKKCGTTSD